MEYTSVMFKCPIINYILLIPHCRECQEYPLSRPVLHAEARQTAGTKRPRHHSSGAGAQEEVVEFGGTRECRRREGSALAHGEGSLAGNIPIRLMDPLAGFGRQTGV